MITRLWHFPEKNLNKEAASKQVIERISHFCHSLNPCKHCDSKIFVMTTMTHCLQRCGGLVNSQGLVFHQTFPIQLIGVCLFSDNRQAQMPMIAMVECYGEVPAIFASRLNQKCQSRGSNSCSLIIKSWTKFRDIQDSWSSPENALTTHSLFPILHGKTAICSFTEAS